MSIKKQILGAQEAALCFVRKWWRPLTCVGLCASVWSNLVVIPLVKWTVPDLTQGAAYVTAVVAAFAVREAGKYLGTADKD